MSAPDDAPWFEPLQTALALWFAGKTTARAYVELLERAVAAGDLLACYVLGSELLHGPRRRRDPARGLRLLRRASASVHQAMTELASAHELGELGLAVDERKAFRLFERAVAHGSVAARYHLGRCYACGVGTRRDAAAARRLWRAACRLGFPSDGRIDFAPALAELEPARRRPAQTRVTRPRRGARA